MGKELSLNILEIARKVQKLESVGGESADTAKMSDIATEFSATTNYTAGCFVYYEGKLYQFNTDHSAGAWDPTDVVEANVTDQVVSNKAAIEAMDDRVDALDGAVPRTSTGTTLAELVTALGQLTDEQKMKSILMLGGMRLTSWSTSVYHAFQLRSDSSKMREIVFDGSATPPTFGYREQSTIGSAATWEDISNTTWSLYYSGSPIT